MSKTFVRRAALLAAIVVLTALAGAGAPARAGEGDPCTKASQCRGFLPHFCKVCSNGRSACAHWACVQHKCEIQSCPR
jgi:hypothetical protein